MMEVEGRSLRRDTVALRIERTWRELQTQQLVNEKLRYAMLNQLGVDVPQAIENTAGAS